MKEPTIPGVPLPMQPPSNRETVCAPIGGSAKEPKKILKTDTEDSSNRVKGESVREHTHQRKRKDKTRGRQVSPQKVLQNNTGASLDLGCWSAEYPNHLYGALQSGRHPNEILFPPETECFPLETPFSCRVEKTKGKPLCPTRQEEWAVATNKVQ